MFNKPNKGLEWDYKASDKDFKEKAYILNAKWYTNVSILQNVPPRRYWQRENKKEKHRKKGRKGKKEGGVEKGGNKKRIEKKIDKTKPFIF